MKKSVKRVLSAVVGLSAFLCVSSTSFAATAPDDKVNISVEFEKAEYFPGDTATAYLKVTGISDEVDAGYKLGAFETHIKFDNTKLGFKNGIYNTAMEVASTDTRNIAVATDAALSNMVIAAFHSIDGVTISEKEDGTFVIAEILFDVLGSVSGEAFVEIETENYQSVFELPKSGGFKELECTETEESSKINITSYNYIIASNGAVATDTAITDTVTVAKKNEQVANAQLIAGLYEKGGKLLLSQVVIKNVGIDAQPYNISFNRPAVPAGTQLEVRYYLWNSTAIVSPLAPKKIVAVE